jgi:chromosome segregation ATPase
LSLSLAACASTSPSLSRNERERLPLDGRQEIFDAENDLIIARNRADLAQDHLRAVEDALEQLDDRQDRSEKRLSANAATSGNISPLRKVTRAERNYLDARRDVGLAEVEVAKQEIHIARVRLDQVKQRQLVRIGKAPITSLAAFEKSLQDEEERGKQTRSSSLDLRTKAQTLLDAWKTAQAGYAGQTRDFDSGIWLE